MNLLSKIVHDYWKKSLRKYFLLSWATIATLGLAYLFFFPGTPEFPVECTLMGQLETENDPSSLPTKAAGNPGGQKLATSLYRFKITNFFHTDKTLFFNAASNLFINNGKILKCHPAFRQDQTGCSFETTPSHLQFNDLTTASDEWITFYVWTVHSPDSIPSFVLSSGQNNHLITPTKYNEVTILNQIFFIIGMTILILGTFFLIGIVRIPFEEVPRLFRKITFLSSYSGLYNNKNVNHQIVRDLFILLGSENFNKAISVLVEDKKLSFLNQENGEIKKLIKSIDLTFPVGRQVIRYDSLFEKVISLLTRHSVLVEQLPLRLKSDFKTELMRYLTFCGK